MSAKETAGRFQRDNANCDGGGSVALRGDMKVVDP